ncbi:MAG: hypothetical protein ACRD29_12100 [Acidimicrobiales bacterium]
MTVPLKLGLFAVGLAAALGLGAAAGALVPGQGGDEGVEEADHDVMAGEADDHEQPGHDGDAATDLLGLPAAAGGYRLDVADPTVAASQDGAAVQFRILDADGRPVREFTEENEALLHLIVVRRDLTGFQHLHPVLDTESGTWTTAVQFNGAGTRRLIVDALAADGDDTSHVILGADVDVDGEFAGQPLPPATDRVEVDGFGVTLGEPPTSDGSHPVVVCIDKDGRPVTDLDPYLGNAGHLVVLRAGDLAYTHLHSDSEAGGPDLRFAGSLPSPGTYRMFVQFAADGAVHTAAFTVDVMS